MIIPVLLYIRVIAFINIVDVFFLLLQDGRCRDPVSVLRQVFSGVILCTPRMLYMLPKTSNAGLAPRAEEPWRYH